MGGCTQGLIDSVCNNVPKQFPDICGQLPTGPVLSQIDKCLASRDPTSPACAKVGDLKAACQDARYKGSLVCQLVNRGPVPTVPGTSVAPAADADVARHPGPRSRRVRQPDVVRRRGARPDSDLGALLVWGMVQR